MNIGPSDRTYLPSRVFETGWLIAAVLVPLTFNPWGQNPFEPPKVAVLRTVAFSLAVAWAVLVLAYPRHRSSSAWTNPLLVPALALIGVQTAATALARVETRRGLAVADGVDSMTELQALIDRSQAPVTGTPGSLPVPALATATATLTVMVPVGATGGSGVTGEIIVSASDTGGGLDQSDVAVSLIP